MSKMMVKPGSVPCEVNDAAVEAFEAEGWTVVEGDAPPPEPEKPELSKAEIASELKAVEKKIRREGKEKGLEKDEIEADVQAELSRVKIRLGVK